MRSRELAGMGTSVGPNTTPVVDAIRQRGGYGTFRYRHDRGAGWPACAAVPAFGHEKHGPNERCCIIGRRIDSRLKPEVAWNLA